MATTDKIVQDLINVITEKKKAITKAEKPEWKTNSAFKFSKDHASIINIQACGDVDILLEIVGFLKNKKDLDRDARELLSMPILEFKWLNYTFDEWLSDIKTRIDKIQILSKKKELEMLEERLNKLISPELRAQMELENIQKLLNDGE